MHDTALELGRRFFETYLPADRPAAVLDIGSMDVNGSLRQVVPAGRSVAYTGVDIEPGPGVDVVVPPSARLPFEPDSFDAVVSTSAFEHDSAFWQSFEEMARVTRPGGYIYVNAPSNGHVHQHPRDCWRFYPDAGLALADWVNRGLVEKRVVLVESFVFDRMGAEWNDAVMVFARTPARSELPRPPLCRDERARNIRLRGQDGLGRFEPLTEDQRLGMTLGTMAHHLLASLRAETEFYLKLGGPLLSIVVVFDQTTTSDAELDDALAALRSEAEGAEIVVVHEGPLERPTGSRLVFATDGIFESPRELALSNCNGLYVLETTPRHRYRPGALAELSASLRAEPVGMLVCRLEGEADGPLDPRQVVLRLGVAVSPASRDYEALTASVGYCQSAIVLGAR